MNNFFKMSDIFMFQLPRKIIFGNGAIKRIGEEASGLFMRKTKILIVTDKGVIRAKLLEEAIASLQQYGFDITIFDKVMPDPPISLIMECTDLARGKSAEIIFGIGGGSSLDAAKAVSIMVPYKGEISDWLGANKVKHPGLPKILVPTTAGTGSELSNALVLTDDCSGDKIAVSSPYIFSDLSIIDPVLTLGLPPKITAESGMDAFSHALESFLTIKANPLSDVFSIKGIEIISKNLREAYAKGAYNLEARYGMCLGVCMGTMAIRSSGMGMIHGTCYPPAMKYHLSHGLAISIMMPYVMEYNLISNREKYAAIALAMGEKVENLSLRDTAEKAVIAVKRLIEDLGLPSKLREVGVQQEDCAEFAKTVVTRYQYHMENNPRNVTEQDILRIYESAW